MTLPDRASVRVVVPDHVVYRDFPEETVVLNLVTGQYHGLNPVAGRMLEVVEASPNVAAAVRAISAEYVQPEDRVGVDVDKLLETLSERGIVQLTPIES